MSRSRTGFTLLELLGATVAVGLLIVLLLRGLSGSPRTVAEKPRNQPERASPELIGLAPSVKIVG